MKLNLQLAKLTIFLVLLAGLTACSKQAAPKNNAIRLPKVTVAQPTLGKVERIINSLGTLEAEDQLQITSQVPGIVQEVKFEEGQEVKQDTVLVVLDPTNFKLNLENAQTFMEKAKSGLALAQNNYDRNKNLYEKKFITDQTLQELATVLDKAKSDVTSAEVTCKLAEKALADSIIKAPVDSANKNYSWEVQDKLVSIGEYINPGKPLADLVNRATLKLRFTVPEQEAGYLAIGKTVRFTVPALPNKEFEAKIIFLGPLAVENSRAVIVKARFDNTELILRPGYSANARFVAETKEKAIIISRRSLRFDVDSPYVLIVNDETVRKKPVVVGIELENTVEIISGISPTDTVVVRSSSFLEDGTKVEAGKDE